MRDVGDNPTILDPDAAANVYQAEAALLDVIARRRRSGV